MRIRIQVMNITNVEQKKSFLNIFLFLFAYFNTKTQLTIQKE